MSERRQDFELLQRFARHGEQSAFADVVRRHLDLVFGTALRKVEDASAAQEVAQNVFAALARKAWHFAPDDSVPAWLHKTALLECNSWLRGELRRRRRENTAAELGTTMNTPHEQPTFLALVPLLDEALLSLREKDRTALLLRFYESHSPRDVGAAFGVSEDTAQKRVQSALEKLTEFFKRRGFKTASVAAAAAALQHTAVSTSTAVASTVIGTVLQAAPPALAGLSLLLARLSSLSRVQTAALCVVAAALPVCWQLNEQNVATDEARRMQAQLLATQREVSNAQAELETLWASFNRAQQTAAQRQEEADRAAESARAFEVWKQRTRSQLRAADYLWDDDSPFVRVPKTVLPEFSELAYGSPFYPPGIVTTYARELMTLTPAERQSLEGILQRVAELQHGEQADVYEKDGSTGGRVVAARVFMTDPTGVLGTEAEQRFAQMLTDMHNVLGEERWPVLPGKYKNANCDLWNSALIPPPTGVVTASVEVDEQGTPKALWHVSGDLSKLRGDVVVPPASGTGKGQGGIVYSVNVIGYQNNSAALSVFLPVADANQASIAVSLGGVSLPDAIHRQMVAWFQEQAAARLSGKEKP